MKRRIHSSLHSRHANYNLEELLQVKAKMISLGRTHQEQSHSQTPFPHKQGRSVTLAPSQLYSPPHFLQFVGYSTPKVAPPLRLKATTIISKKPFNFETGQKFSKMTLSKFNKLGECKGKICGTCEEKHGNRAKLFKRRK